MLVGPDAPLAGIFTIGFALEPQLEKTASGKRHRTYKEKELEIILNDLKTRVADEAIIKTQESSEKEQEIDVSQMAYSVERKTKLATDYITENLSDKFQFALLELIKKKKVRK